MGLLNYTKKVQDICSRHLECKLVALALDEYNNVTQAVIILILQHYIVRA